MPDKTALFAAVQTKQIWTNLFSPDKVSNDV